MSNDDNFIYNCCFTGFDNTNVSISGLAENWEYEVTVFAIVVDDANNIFETEATYDEHGGDPPKVTTKESSK